MAASPAPAADEVLELAKTATVVAIGPGLGRDPALTQLVARLYREIDKPMVVDADALFALAESFGVLGEPGGMRVLTPHPGEFARFTNERPDARSSHRSGRRAGVARFDPTNRSCCSKAIKRSSPTASAFSVNHTGNPGMATGGAGDVLTGIITGLLCQGMEPFDAARLGAYLHGTAGDLAVESVGEVSMIASDLIDYLPMAFQALRQIS